MFFIIYVKKCPIFIRRGKPKNPVFRDRPQGFGVGLGAPAHTRFSR